MLELESHLGQLDPDKRESALLVATGRIDATNSDQLKKELDFFLELKNPITHLILSLTNVEYLSTSGMRDMIYIHKKAIRAGGSLTLELRRAGRCQEVIELTGLETVFSINFQD